MKNSSTMADRDIDVCIKKIASGDMTALRELYDVLRVPIYKFALSITKSPDLAEDIAQETFLRIRVYAQTYCPKGKPKAWIFSIVRNLAISELRQATKIVDIDELDDSLISSVDNVDIDELSLFDLLNSDEKEIVSLHVLADLNHSDIAKTMDMPYEQVRWKYAYAMKKLRKHLTHFEKREGVWVESEKV